jgi:hypothetical protein
MLGWRTGTRIFVEPRVPIVRVRSNEAVLPPSDDRTFMDAETPRDFLLGQQATIAKAVIAGTESIPMHEVGDAQRRKRRREPTWSNRAARVESSHVELVGDLRVGVMVQQLIDELHYRWCRLHLLR